jgi:hypothetical protein
MFPRDMVCLRNISVDTLYKGDIDDDDDDDDDDDNKNNNNNNNFLVITFMQGIYNYITETDLNYRVYGFAVVLYLQFVLRVMLLHS